MAGFVGYRKTAWDNANNSQRAVLRTVLNNLELGEPARGTVNGVEWLVFHDARIDAKLVENLGWLNSILTSITTAPVRDYPTMEIVQQEVPVRIQVEVFDEDGNSFDPPVFVWQDHPTDTQLVDVEVPLGDPLTLAASAQATHAWFAAAQNLPESWIPAEAG